MKLTSLIQPVVEDLGYEFVGLEHSSNPKNPALVLYIDRPGGIAVEDCEKVSREVAAAMAAGVRERSHVSIGLSVTGIAGPGGATPTKPVGLVYVALDAGEAGREAKEFRFHGDRSTIKTRSSQGALDLLRRWLLSKGQP